MIQHRLRFQLEKVASRYRDLRFWQLLAVAWLVASVVGALLWVWKTRSGAPTVVAASMLCIVPLALAGLAFWLASRSARSYEWVARQIEIAFPELQTCLLAAVEQRPDLPDGRYGYLQSDVIRQALEHASRHTWPDVIPKQSFAFAGLANLVTFALFAAALVAIAFNMAPPLAAAGLPSGNDDALVPAPFVVTVEPGDAEVEKGTSLLVLARVQGPLPAEAELVHKNASGEETRLPMAASLEDPVFGGRIPSVEEALTYHVELGGHITSTYRIDVFEYPRLERADVHLVYPAYTGMEERLVQDVRVVSVVEGTEVTLRCLLNKSVPSAVLVDVRTHAPSIAINLKPSTSEPLLYEAMIPAQESRKLRLELTDDAGRKNVKPYQFSINVLPNQPPNVKPVFPAKDLEVSALEEIDVKATVWDDFGVKRTGLTYSLAGKEPVDVVVAEDAAAKQKHELAASLRLEELQAEPDQLLSYYWWAEDHGPDSQIRRTMSDMYFAEVRPFEEIFRQGEQPPGGQQQQQQQNQQGQGQNAQQAQELAKLQKEIINATWKLIRREIGTNLSDAFSADVEQVLLSQTAAREQAEGLAERVQDEQSKQHVDDVLTFMQQAADRLKNAHETPAREPLQPALAAEQAAYQALLKLRAREHEVVRQQQLQQGQQSSQQSSSRSQQQQQQLQQLDLRQEENRYETQRAAQEQQQESAEERENRQVLNRLRELARRQSDLNERVKELQSALEEARTEEQKEELKRQLQRLQEEQRQILQDTDELQSRLEQPENAERMSQERQQLEETRDQVRRASEALEEQRITQAAASGTRAEQQFDELREEFRRRAANRFTEEVQQMRQAARELDEREQKLAEQLKQATEPQERRSLSAEDPREQIAQELTRQRQRLSNLQDQMRDTIQRAEDTEPLLTERLYDTARDIQDRKLDQTLQATEQSVRRGLAQDAQQQEAAAAEGIRQVREGIEKAAEGVLGDEAEALRRAREELRDLSRQLNDEIDRNLPPENREQEAGDREQEAGDRSQQGKSGQQQPGLRQPGEGQQGQPMNPRGAGRPGEQQGEPMPGQGERGKGEPMPPGQDPGRGQTGGNPQQEQPGQERPGEPGERQQPGQGNPMGQGEERGQQPGMRPTGPQEGQDNPTSELQQAEGQPGRSQQTERGERGPNRGQRLGGDDPRAGSAGPFQDYVPGEFSPITGSDFREWSDRLRDVEEMVDDSDLRAEAARIRERAREFRAEIKRHSEKPQWDVLRDQVAEPLAELEERVAEELLRRTSKNALVPLDRDPVPPQYSEKTRRYYERLGAGTSDTKIETPSRSGK